MYYRPGVWFYLAAAVSLIIMLIGFGSRYGVWLRGKGPERKPVKMLGFVPALLGQIFLQSNLRRLSVVRWLIHLAVFYGFIGLLLQTSWLFLLDDFLPEKSALVQFFYHGPGQMLLDVWGDFWGATFIAGILAALLRRIIGLDQRIQNDEEDLLALLLLLLIGLSGFLLEALRIRLLPQTDRGFALLGLLSSRTIPATGEGLYRVVLDFHILISLVFIAYLPYSKLLHLLTTPVSAAIKEASGDE